MSLEATLAKFVCAIEETVEKVKEQFWRLRWKLANALAGAPIIYEEDKELWEKLSHYKHFDQDEEILDRLSATKIVFNKVPYLKAEDRVILDKGFRTAVGTVSPLSDVAIARRTGRSLSAVQSRRYRLERQEKRK